MTQLYWQTIGTGDRNLVMLHGWGLNADVWQNVVERLSRAFLSAPGRPAGLRSQQGFCGNER